LALAEFQSEIRFASVPQAFEVAFWEVSLIEKGIGSSEYLCCLQALEALLPDELGSSIAMHSPFFGLVYYSGFGIG
jgi:hypothetical protein